MVRDTADPGAAPPRKAAPSPLKPLRHRLGTPLCRYLHETLKGPLRLWNAVVLAAALGLCCLLGAALMWSAIRSAALILVAGYLVLLLAFCLLLLGRMIGRLNDLQYAITLQNNLQRLPSPPRDFFTEGAAANPSLQLLLLKCLAFCRPQRILELGSGQTTKLLASYHRENPDTYVLTLEQDERWAELLRPQVSGPGRSPDYRHRPLSDRMFTCPGLPLRIQTHWFGDVPELKASQFELIVVDGPDAGGEYARSGILEYMPGILGASFVVIFDDAERYGERRTIRVFRQILRAHGRKFAEFEVHGVKTQAVFCSPDFRFLQSV